MVVEPSLLLTEVDEAPASACNSGSVVAPGGIGAGSIGRLGGAAALDVMVMAANMLGRADDMVE